MSESLRFESSEDTPLIDFDIDTGVFKITGRALPEDAHEFFKPIEDWVDTYIESPLDNTLIEMRIDYFNSTATRYIFNLLMSFEEIADSGKNVKVLWYYNAEDEIIKSKGEEMESILELPFELRII